MGRLGKRKGKVNQFGRRPFTRGQAQADADALAQVDMDCPELTRLCCDFELTDVVRIWYDDDSDEDEAEHSSALVSVGSYRVKIVAAPMLRCILEKHGDIAVDCSLTSVEGRSMLLQSICDIMHILIEFNFIMLSKSEIQDMLTVVGKLGELNLRVGWLRTRLKEILDAKKKASTQDSKIVRKMCYYDELVAKVEELEFAFEVLDRKFHLEWEKILGADKVIKDDPSSTNAKAAVSGLTEESRKALDCYVKEIVDLRAKLKDHKLVIKVEVFKSSMVNDLY